MIKYDYLIVGSGLYGSVAAYILTELGKKCLVIDKRNELGGNVYCEYKDGECEDPEIESCDGEAQFCEDICCECPHYKEHIKAMKAEKEEEDRLLENKRKKENRTDQVENEDERER